MAIIGNTKTIKLLDRIVETGKIANAYLFLGPENVGKFTVALEFAKKLTGSDGKVNFDLIIIAPETEEKKGVTKKLDIKVEMIRELQHKLNLTSAGGKYKAVIIDDAERLNKMAQNALLKTLEEPNEKVVLILVSQNEKKILPTIASRCQKIKFGSVDDTDIEKIIPAEANNKKEIIFWALGRPGIAVGLINDPAELEFRKRASDDLTNLFSGNISEKFSMADEMSKDAQMLIKKKNLWLIILRQSMFRKDKLSVKIYPDKALRLIEEITASLEALRDTNSNSKLILENLFLKFTLSNNINLSSVIYKN